MILVNQEERISFAFERMTAYKCGLSVKRDISQSNTMGHTHRHDYPQVWYCYQGKYQHTINGITYDCAEGSLVIVPIGVIHNVSYIYGQADIMVLNLSYKMFLDTAPAQWINTIGNLCMPAFSKDLKYTPQLYFELTNNSRQQAEDVFSWLAMLEYTSWELIHKKDVYEKIEALFSLPEFCVPEGQRTKMLSFAQTRLYPVLRIIAYLNNHYGEKIDDEILSQESGISRTGMYRYFNQITGCTCSKYLQRLRLGHAAMRLRLTTFSLSHIADICGFCDTRHMTQLFTRYYGKSPGKSRVQIKQAKCNQGRKNNF